jgi:hypothetical protein
MDLFNDFMDEINIHSFYFKFINDCFKEPYRLREKQIKQQNIGNSSRIQDNLQNGISSDEEEENYMRQLSIQSARQHLASQDLIRFLAGSTFHRTSSYTPRYFGMTRQEAIHAIKTDLMVPNTANWIKLNANHMLPRATTQHLDQVQQNIKQRTVGDRIQVFSFPLNLGTSHLYPQDWQHVFDFLDCVLSAIAIPINSHEEHVTTQQYLWRHVRIRTRTNENDVEAQVPPVIMSCKDVEQSLWMDLIFNERVKNQQYFWKLERILNYLGINPCSSQPLQNSGRFYPAHNEHNTENPLALMNIAKSKRKKQLMELVMRERERTMNNENSGNDNDDSPFVQSPRRRLSSNISWTRMTDDQPIDEPKKKVTCAKVLLVLLYFMNDYTQDRLVRTYIRSIREKYGTKFLEILMFVLYVVHIKVDLMNPLCIDVITNEFSKNVAATSTFNHIPQTSHQKDQFSFSFFLSCGTNFHPF